MIVAFDVETTTHNKGNPYDSRNSLVCWSYYTSSDDGRAVHHSEPGSLGLVSQLFDTASLILGFNLKFDLHWARKLGITYNPKKSGMYKSQSSSCPTKPSASPLLKKLLKSMDSEEKKTLSKLNTGTKASTLLTSPGKFSVPTQPLTPN